MISWHKLFPWAFFFPFPSSKKKQKTNNKPQPKNNKQTNKQKAKKGGQKDKLNIKISDLQKWNLRDAEIEAVLL